MRRLGLTLLMVLGLSSCGGSEEVQIEVRQPAPDCAPQNCQGLRIIDGNAEAYRYDSLNRDPAPSGN